ncbi:anticodon-binding domain-containing protein [Chytridium lagenaria]|nr:anticodon-binding domain-containing protein [Chytridium lagenaria]
MAMASAGAASSILGYRVRVTLITDDVKEGLVFAYEPVLGILVLQSQPITPPAADSSLPSPSPSVRPDFHIIKVGSIKDVVTLLTTGDAAKDGNGPEENATSKGTANGTENVWTSGKKFSSTAPSTLLPVNHVPIEKILAREHSVLKAEADRIAKIGVGVTDDAQELFYALDKTLPTRWTGTTIVVMDEVQIRAPYSANDVHGPTAASVSRVKKVLELERKRLLSAKGGK